MINFEVETDIFVSTEYTNVTDRRTDEQTDTTRQQAALMHSIARQKRISCNSYIFEWRDTYTCLEIGSRQATLRRGGVGVALSVVWEHLWAVAATTRCDGADVRLEVADSATGCTRLTSSKSSSSADSAKRVKSNLRWTTVKPAPSASVLLQQRTKKFVDKTYSKFVHRSMNVSRVLS